MFTRRSFLRSAACAAGFAAGIRISGAAEEDCDVLVVGGSLGGVAAALAAARQGLRVVLVEETQWIGGQATTQGVPLDEHPQIEQYGRTKSYAEFRSGVRAYYRTNYPLIPAAKADALLNPGACWVSACGFEPRVGMAVLHQMLAPYLSSGAIRLYSRVIATKADTQEDFCRAVELLDLEEIRRFVVHARYFIDGTELGDLLPLAGVEFVTGTESRSETGEPTAVDGPAQPLHMQGFTHLIAVDYLPGEDHTIGKPSQYEYFAPELRGFLGIAEGDEMALRMKRMFASDNQAHYVQTIWNFRRLLCARNFAAGKFPSDVTVLMNGNEYGAGSLIGVSEEERKRHMDAARQMSLSLLYFFQTEVAQGYKGRPGLPGLRPRGDVFGTTDGLAQFPYIRESRRIRALKTILEQDFRMDLHPDGPVPQPDSVGTSGYRMDIHERGEKASRTIELSGKHWAQQLPLGALIPLRVQNILPGCKNIGSTHVTNGAFRVHPAEWNVGESAGALTAYCLRRQVSPRDVWKTSGKLREFQKLLTGEGIEIAWPKPTVALSYNAVYGNRPGWDFGEAWRRAKL
jgi:FAD dependent oxidoreductase